MSVLSLLGAVGFAQQATLAPQPRISFTDASGVPLVGGALYTYAAGTTTPQATCSTNGITAGACTVANTNPITLDAFGRATVYLLPKAYKFVLNNAQGVQQYTQDNVPAMLPYNQTTATSTLTFSPATTLTLASNAVVPSLNVHALDTSGGAQNLNTLTTTSVTTPFLVILYGNNPGANPVTVKTGAGNITLRGGDFVLNSSTRYLTLLLSGTTWFEVARSDFNAAVMGPELKAYYETSNTAAITSNVLTLDLSTGNHFSVALNANITTLTISNVPATGKAAAFTVAFTADGTARTITWPAAVKWPSGVAPTVTSTNGKVDIFTFITYTGGTTWFSFIGGQNF